MKKGAAFLILRVSIAIVFLIFGIGKFQNDYWARTIATMDIFKNLPWGTDVSIFLIGVLEVLTALFLMLGVWMRPVAAVASAQLFSILILLNFDEIRDIGLFGATVCLFLSDEKFLSIDGWIAQKRKSQ